MHFTPSSPLSSGLTAPCSRADRSRSPSAGKLEIPYIEIAGLVHDAQGGNREAQSELVRRYQVRVAGFVHKMIRHRNAVEDIVQTIMIRMIRRLPFLREPKVFESWLFRMARNEVVDAIRRIKCRVTLVEETSDGALSCDRNEYGHFEIQEAVNHAIECLPDPEREIMLLVIAGHTYHSIAARTGLTPSAVKLRVFRMRQILRPRMRAALGEAVPTEPVIETKPLQRKPKRKRKLRGNAGAADATVAVAMKPAPGLRRAA